MDPRDQPLRSAEFLVVDVETNGRQGEDCELTEVGAVLVGGGELHERFSSLVAVTRPLPRGIQRFTGITQEMADSGAPPRQVLRELAQRLRNRVLVAHAASFDRRVLRDAFARADLEWPAPPVLCTLALARRFAPLARQLKLATLADTLGIEVGVTHRALPDAETCARVFCALFGKLCANATTVGDAVAMFARRPRRRRGRPPPAVHAQGGRIVPAAEIDFDALPSGPGVYLFRDGAGRPLYVGKSVSLRARARSHFRPGAEPAGWTAHAALLDHRPTRSELGALLLENRLIKELRPPGNVRLRRVERHVYVRCRLDIAYPILEVAPDPAAGHALNVGPLRGRSAAVELVEQLNSLFGLRHCGRRLPRREHPSAYGQMGRCLSPCLGDLDPNLYRRRLDDALSLFLGSEDGRARLLAHIEQQMRESAAELRFERAAGLRRRHRRLRQLLQRLEGVLQATHARSRLVLAGDERVEGCDAFWLVGGRVADWGPLPAEDELERRTHAAVARGAGLGSGAHLPPEEIDEVRIVAAWLAAHPEVPSLALDRSPEPAHLRDFIAAAA